MSRNVLVVTVGILVSVSASLGEQPFTANWQTESLPTVSFTGPDSVNWHHVPGSSQSLTLPAGTAFMTWYVNAAKDRGRIRAVIGDTIGSEWIWTFAEINGSWSGNIPQGTVDVKLQARTDAIGVLEFDSIHEVRWTLMVIPETPQGSVPAVSTWGLIVMAILMLSAGTLVMTRRKPVVV